MALFSERYFIDRSDFQTAAGIGADCNAFCTSGAVITVRARGWETSEVSRSAGPANGNQKGCRLSSASLPSDDTLAWNLHHGLWRMGHNVPKNPSVVDHDASLAYGGNFEYRSGFRRAVVQYGNAETGW